MGLLAQIWRREPASQGLGSTAARGRRSGVRRQVVITYTPSTTARQRGCPVRLPEVAFLWWLCAAAPASQACRIVGTVRIQPELRIHALQDVRPNAFDLDSSMPLHSSTSGVGTGDRMVMGALGPVSSRMRPPSSPRTASSERDVLPVFRRYATNLASFWNEFEQSGASQP